MQAAQASYSGAAQHQKQGRCATISIPTLDRLKLRSIVSYSIVWWMQAAQASYSGGEARPVPLAVLETAELVSDLLEHWWCYEGLRPT